MGLDMELASILREVVQFLECLQEAKLSVTLETIRGNLLFRSRNTLSAFRASDRSTSHEPYLNMNAGSKGLLAIKVDNINESDLQDYVGPEKETIQVRPALEIQRDYYETFPSTDQSNINEEKNKEKLTREKKNNKDLSIESTLVEIYSNLSAIQAKDKCQKCGPLYRKEGKKLFVFEQYRSCWAALVGAHLLIYGNERHCRPYIVQCIRGYAGRPAPSTVPRDHRRSESAFEIFSPGNKTLQFIARTPKDMEQWVAKITHIGSNDNNEDGPQSKIGNTVETVEPESHEIERSLLKEQTIRSECNKLKMDNETETEKSIKNSTVSPPPLPARIPRRLPSLPSSKATLSYETMDDEEDYIYHRIEDFGNTTHYQNLSSPKTRQKSVSNERCTKVEEYDDVRTVGTKIRDSKLPGIQNSKINKEKMINAEEVYDDILATREGTLLSTENQNDTPNSTTIVAPTYHDNIDNPVVNKISSEKESKEIKEETHKKSPHKKSFLDKVRNKKESSRKQKRLSSQREIKTPPPISSIEELPTYDDVSKVSPKQKLITEAQELSEYNCPPIPRPIYVRPPLVDKINDSEEFYDDVSAYRENYKNEECKIAANTQQQHTKAEVHAIEKLCPEDQEHYQSPRNESCRQSDIKVPQEELYDDIAILTDFTTRRKEMVEERNKDNDIFKSNSNPEKWPWNKFVSGKKSKPADTSGCEINERPCNETEDIDCCNDEQTFVRKNTFQKLINKMENSLGKTSTKTIISPSSNKTNTINNVS